MSIVVDEILSNIIHHAYGSAVGEAKIQLDHNEEDSVLSMTFIDKGVPFDPREVAEPDTNLSLDERPIGGLGLFIVKQLVDAIEYQRADGCNILTLRKRA